MRSLCLMLLLLTGCAGSPETSAPRDPLEAFPLVIESNDGTYWVGIRLPGGDPRTPPFDELYSLEIAVEPKNGTRGAPESFTLDVDATMPHHGHGMNVLPEVTCLGPGRFIARGFELFMEGEWLLTLDISTSIGDARFDQPLYTERAQLWIEPR